MLAGCVRASLLRWMLLRGLHSCISTCYALRWSLVLIRRACALKWVCPAGSLHFKVRIVLDCFVIAAPVRRKGGVYVGSPRFKDVFSRSKT